MVRNLLNHASFAVSGVALQRLTEPMNLTEFGFGAGRDDDPAPWPAVTNVPGRYCDDRAGVPAAAPPRRVNQTDSPTSADSFTPVRFCHASRKSATT